MKPMLLFLQKGNLFHMRVFLYFIILCDSVDFFFKFLQIFLDYFFYLILLRLHFIIVDLDKFVKFCLENFVLLG